MFSANRSCTGEIEFVRLFVCIFFSFTHFQFGSLGRCFDVSQ